MNLNSTGTENTGSVNGTPPNEPEQDQDQNKHNLLRLPTEVLDLIIADLSWPDITTLRLTHRHFTEKFLPSLTLTIFHFDRKFGVGVAELRHVRTTLGYTNPNYTGFTQGWGLETKTSLAPTLPCYHCLRWLPSADATLATSAFSRGMSTGKRDLGQDEFRLRVCVDCGVRCGMYGRGARVRHQPVCVACGKLGDKVSVPNYGYVSAPGYDQGWTGPRRLLKGVLFRYFRFCSECITAGRVPETRMVFEHERRCGKYEKSMERGKRYRLEKGRRLRVEKGIEDEKGGTDDRDEHTEVRYQPKHVCPVMKEKRICPCWKTADGKLPEWARRVEHPFWIW